MCAEQAILARGHGSVAGSSGQPLVLTDEEGVIAFLRDDFMRGTEEATSTVDAFLHAMIASFGKLCMEQFGGWFTPDSACLQYTLALHAYTAQLSHGVASPKRGDHDDALPFNGSTSCDPRRQPREGEHVALLWGWSMGV